MEQKTNLRKNFHGWIATTYFPLASGRQLKVYTSKDSRGRVDTTAQAVKSSPSGSGGFTMEEFELFGDYNKKIMDHPEVKRVTDKAISTSHAKALESVQPFIEEANEFYVKKDAKKVAKPAFEEAIFL